MRTQLLDAWCDELRRVVSIEEAYRYSTSFLPARVLTFRCPDAQCRHERNPRVAGANYRVHLDTDERRRWRYFRAISDQAHRAGCPIVVDMKATTSPARRPDRQADSAKQTNVIDVFLLPQGDGPAPTSAAAGSLSLVGPAQAGPAEMGVRDTSNSGLTTSRRVERLLDVFDRLGSAKARDAATISLDGVALSYCEAFRPPPLLEPHHANARRILLGNASYRRVSEGSAWVLRFYDPLARFEPVGGARSLSVWLPLDRLERSAAGIRLHNLLGAEGAARAHYFRLCALGTIRPSRTEGYVLLLDSLFNMALDPLQTMRSRPENSASTAQNDRR